MKRVLTAFAILVAIVTTLAVPAYAGTLDQAGWTARKQSIRLANGIHLSYVEMGDPRGSPVLLLHGWTDSSRAWTIVAPELMKHRLLIPDQRGHGGSDAPECCYAVSNFAHDALLFLDAMGVEKASVVGHSLGSMVGQVLAAEHPERIEKLVLIGSTALAPVKRGDWLWTNVNKLSFPLDPKGDFMRQWSPGASPTPVDRDYLAYADPETAAVPRQVWKGVLREVVELPVGRFAQDIKAPTLILSGGADSLFPPEHHEALVNAIPHAKGHVFPGLGHNFILEQPDKVAPAIRNFLAD